MLRGLIGVMCAAVLAGCTSFRGAMPGSMGEILRPPAAAKKIRVAIQLSLPSAMVKVAGPGTLFDREQRQRISRFALLHDTVFRLDAHGRLATDGRSTTAHRITVMPDMPQSLWVNGTLYRGTVEIIVNQSGSLDVVNTLPLDEYLMGVVPKETFAAWPEAALRAQAVAARSFAAYHIRHNAKDDYDIIAPTHQLYGGASAEDPRSTKAVLDTQGEVITFRGDVLCTFFHTCCGGHTEEASVVFPNITAYPPGVSSPYCTASPHYAWHHSVAAINFAEKLRTAGKPAQGPVARITDIQRLPSGRVSRFRVHTQAGSADVGGEECRKLLGYDNVRSTLFSVSVRGDRIEFSGRGWGHGVGLCQWCSKDMADKGKTYEEILGHFYPGAALHK